MKSFRITLTINVFVEAEDLESAIQIAQEMDYSFSEPTEELYPLPENVKQYENDIIDWEVTELEEDGRPKDES